MQLTYSINEEFTVELDGERLRDDYEFYRKNYPNLDDTDILKNIYKGFTYQIYSARIISIGFSHILPNNVTATLNLTEDQFIALAREELKL